MMTEIIAWKTRLFIPTDARGPEILSMLMAKNPIVATRAKAA